MFCVETVALWLEHKFKEMDLLPLIVNLTTVNSSVISTTKLEAAASLRWLAFLVLSLTCLVCNEQALKASVNGRNA